ncbi:MAG: hypothetical protein PUG91_10405 [Clostridiales bacterium]|nr:hypothetical protein [Clostridiales bacterium]MDY2872651.1 hypothetical protein [Eubacteriales bacterium]
MERTTASPRQREITQALRESPRPSRRKKAPYIKGNNPDLTRGRTRGETIHIALNGPRRSLQFDGFAAYIMQKNVKIRLNQAENDAF